MKTVFEHIRERLLAPVRAWEGFGEHDPLDHIRETQWVKPFEQLMRNRFVMGRFRYGGDLSTGKGMRGWDYAGSIDERLAAYHKTGNMEHLVDIANLCMLEFTFGEHPKRHFKSVDDGIHVNKD